MKRTHLSTLSHLTAAFLLASIIAALSSPAQAQTRAPAAWRFSLPSGGSTSSTVTLVNRCRQPHRFTVERIDADFVSVDLSAEGIVLAAGASDTRTVRFSARGLAPERYRGELVVVCIDCSREPGCSQDRDHFGIDMTVESTTPQLPELEGVRLEGEILRFGDSKSLAAALRQIDAVQGDSESRRDSYRKVEAQLGHRSLRQSLEERGGRFLGSGRWNDLANPENHFVQDESLRVLLNERGEVAVGDSTYRLWEPGLVVEVPIDRPDLLARLRNGAVDPHAGEVAGLTFHSQARKTDETTGCSAGFSVGDVSGTTIQFTDQSSGTAPMSYSWDFGDGSDPSATASPTHSFASDEPHTVCLQILDGEGCMDTTCQVINDSACYSYFSVTVKDRKATFSNSSLGEGLTYSWTFGDGDSSSAANPTHTYPESGDFYVCLKVSNPFGCEAQYCEFIEISKGECCDRNDRVRHRSTLYDQDRRRIRSVLWQTNLPFLYHRWGARTFNEAKDSGGTFRSAKADTVYALGGGTLYVRGPKGACSLPAPTQWETSEENADKAQFNVSVGQAFWTRAGSLRSIHYVLFDGKPVHGASLSLSSDCARKNCKKVCRTGKRECKTACKTTKKVCKTSCKDGKKACKEGCSGLKGKKKRQCKRGCRKAKRSCKQGCRQGKRSCKQECREGKTECKETC